jgi:hypothetical protein
MSFHLRQLNKLPKPKNFIQPNIPKPPKLINKLNRSFLNYIIDQNDQIKLKNLIKEYLEEKIFIDQLIQFLLQILNKQNQQFRVNFFLFLIELFFSLNKGSIN